MRTISLMPISASFRKARLLIRAGLLTGIGLTMSLQVQAQQTLFSVPTSDITDPKKIFFQQQFNITDQIESSTVFTYGMGRHWEVGIGIGNLVMHPQEHERFVTLDSDQPEENPHLLLNAQHGFDLAERFKIGIGTRTGVSTSGTLRGVSLASFSFLNTQTIIPETNIRVLAGGYYATPAYSGLGSRWGMLFGVDVPIIQQKLRFEGDCLTGTNARSLMMAGLALKIGEDWELAAGAQFPMPGSGNPRGFVIQLSHQ